MTRTDSENPSSQREQVNVAYQIFMLFLCVYALVALSASVLLPLDRNVKVIVQYADLAVCVVFFFDFLLTLKRSPDRWRYLRTWGWIDLLSSIPMIASLRIGRIARVLRILRVLRALKATRLIMSYWLERRSESIFYAIVAVAFSMVVLSSIAVVSFESIPGGNIKTAEDAVWWAITTITTVGYGDYYPVTMEGRAVAAMLMTVGVGLFGMLSGVVVSWFIAPGWTQERAELQELRRAVDDLKQIVAQLAGDKDKGDRR
jgi:voltage-gated potassium channel